MRQPDKKGDCVSPETYEFEAPAHWASVLINGDNTGLDDDEQIVFDRWCERQGGMPNTIDCAAETHFGQFNGLQTELLTYTAFSK